MNDLLAWLVPLLAAGLVGLVAWVVRLAVMLTELRGANTALERMLSDHIKQDEDHVAWNRGQHEELFTSRNSMEKTVERLATLFENMDKKQDRMDQKLDILLERRESAR